MACTASADTHCVENPRCDFHFPQSSTMSLDPSLLRGLSRDTLWEARNEILARHGYAFTTPRARGYFSAKNYWFPRTKNVRLSAVEKANVDLIRSFEAAPGPSLTSAESTHQVEVVRLDPEGDGFLAVRTGPSASFPEVGRLLQGDRATVLAVSGDWRRVGYWGGEGWSHSYWLAPIAVSASVKRSDNPSPNDEELTSLRRDIAAMTAQISELTEIIEKNPSNATTVSAADVDGDGAAVRVAELQERRDEANAILRRYATPVRPEDAGSDPNARQASEDFQKVPYFIPGTSTVGEVWIEPTVSDEGELRFSWNFVDPAAEYQKIELAIPMVPEELEQLSSALQQVVNWSETARKNRVRRAFEKEAACFPAIGCDDVQGPGTATRLMFRIGLDGSTSTVVKRTQGPLDRFYAFSMESTEVMATYFHRVLTESSREYRAATATDDDLDALFE
ncbi:YARHG domain-containing protein [Mesorhizobium sp. CAU 1741]|uniref:YARHG domain-containing protein n=1 Tax=Mesorhizobium sp. CAU 1741 TaxID=3140366 RepID=UPI00325B4C53